MRLSHKVHNSYKSTQAKLGRPPNHTQHTYTTHMLRARSPSPLRSTCAHHRSFFRVQKYPVKPAYRHHSWPTALIEEAKQTVGCVCGVVWRRGKSLNSQSTSRFQQRVWCGSDGRLEQRLHIIITCYRFHQRNTRCAPHIKSDLFT